MHREGREARGPDGDEMVACSYIDKAPVNNSILLTAYLYANIDCSLSVDDTAWFIK